MDESNGRRQTGGAGADQRPIPSRPYTKGVTVRSHLSGPSRLFDASPRGCIPVINH